SMSPVLSSVIVRLADAAGRGAGSAEGTATSSCAQAGPAASSIIAAAAVRILVMVMFVLQVGGDAEALSPQAAPQSWRLRDLASTCAPRRESSAGPLAGPSPARR